LGSAHLGLFELLFDFLLGHASLFAFLFDLASPLLFLPRLLFRDHLISVVLPDTAESNLERQLEG